MLPPYELRRRFIRLPRASCGGALLSLSRHQLGLGVIAAVVIVTVLATTPRVPDTVDDAGVRPVAWLEPPAVQSPPDLSHAPLPPCHHVYLDLGTNTGVQFHKLYNPRYFPDALVRPEFERYFGTSDEERLAVCAFGWEPNPRWAPMHRALEGRYRALNATVRVFSAAAGTVDGTVAFVSDHDMKNREFASTVREIAPGDPVPPGAVPVMDTPGWIAKNVMGRPMPPPKPGWRPPAVLMKVDIEGSDEGVLARLFANGALCGIDYVYTEGHVRETVVSFLLASLRQSGCATRLEFLDDERYLLWEIGQPLPSVPTSPSPEPRPWSLWRR